MCADQIDDGGTVNRWFYADGPQQVGPVGKREILEIVGRIPVGQDLLVWREGFEGWMPARSVAELRPTNLPPPIPSTAPSIPKPSIRITPPATRTTDFDAVRRLRRLAPKSCNLTSDILANAARHVNGGDHLDKDPGLPQAILRQIAQLSLALRSEHYSQDGEDPLHAVVRFLSEYSDAFPNWQREYKFIDSLLEQSPPETIRHNLIQQESQPIAPAQQQSTKRKRWWLSLSAPTTREAAQEDIRLCSTTIAMVAGLQFVVSLFKYYLLQSSPTIAKIQDDLLNATAIDILLAGGLFGLSAWFRKTPTIVVPIVAFGYVVLAAVSNILAGHSSSWIVFFAIVAILILRGLRAVLFLRRRSGDDPEQPAPQIDSRSTALSSSRKWAGNIVLVVVSLIVMSLAGAIGKAIGKAGWGAMQPTVESELADTARRLNKGLPKMVDAITRLDNISAQGNTFTYRYTLLSPDVADQVAFSRITDSLKQHIARSACADDHIKRGFFEHRIAMSHTYFSAGASWLGAIGVTSEDCKNGSTSAASEPSDIMKRFSPTGIR